ncbi:hypothetical protein QVD17_31943 [Tagetes erecta]|uniref:Uncharacterized protein n=1 Tax=Tagetes erecta TaxID=13708 RepID=A0AAD8KAX2_TARER|nr:hypothetical protein QVD17_31943 [Tagetes erecta]
MVWSLWMIMHGGVCAGALKHEYIQIQFLLDSYNFWSPDSLFPEQIIGLHGAPVFGVRLQGSQFPDSSICLV